MLNKKDGTVNWSTSIQWIVIVGLIVLCLYKIMNRSDRELTPQEKRDNIETCRSYYGNGQEYQDCINGNYGRD